MTKRTNPANETSVTTYKHFDMHSVVGHNTIKIEVTFIALFVFSFNQSAVKYYYQWLNKSDLSQDRPKPNLIYVQLLFVLTMR